MSNDRNLIKPILLSKGYKQSDIERFVSYLIKMDTEKKDGGQKNAFMNYISNDKFVELYSKVAAEGLVFDGVHITISSNGISYDYVAYKNKMLIAYPESIIDVQLVYNGDVFSFSKESGSVHYSHIVSNPFGNKDQNIIGAYCVIKNKRGEFLTTLSAEEIEKHRKVAKTDFIWKAWFAEMCLKTIIKKGVRVHFNDVYQNIEIEDNENYDLSKSTIPSNVGLTEIFNKVESCETVEALTEYYNSLSNPSQAIIKLFTARKEKLKTTAV